MLLAAAWLGAVWEFVAIICVAAPLKALNVYAEKRLVTVWRSALTQAFITAYTTNRTYFHLQLATATEGDQALAYTTARATGVGATDKQRDSSNVDGANQRLSAGEDVGSSVVAAVDNPDQRITADVSNYVSTSVSLVLLLGRKLMNCAAFAGKVGQDIVTKLVSYM